VGASGDGHRRGAGHRGDRPGPLSLDAALGTERKGTGWALAALAAGVGGSALLLREWERTGPGARGGGEAS
jgi:hypothetical protein